jgi:hypothetical protein
LVFARWFVMYGLFAIPGLIVWGLVVWEPFDWILGARGWRGIPYVPARRSRRVTALVAESPRSDDHNWGRPEAQ